MALERVSLRFVNVAEYSKWQSHFIPFGTVVSDKSLTFWCSLVISPELCTCRSRYFTCKSSIFCVILASLSSIVITCKEREKQSISSWNNYFLYYVICIRVVWNLNPKVQMLLTYFGKNIELNSGSRKLVSFTTYVLLK